MYWLAVWMSRNVSLGDVGGFLVSGYWASALSLVSNPCRGCPTIDVLQHQSVFDNIRTETHTRLIKTLSLKHDSKEKHWAVFAAIGIPSNSMRKAPS